LIAIPNFGTDDLYLNYVTQFVKPEGPIGIAVEADAGCYLTYIRLVGRRRADMKLAEYAWPDTLRAMLKGTGT
jgi:hypothetical protein